MRMRNLIIVCLFISCNEKINENEQNIFLASQIPDSEPLIFMSDLVNDSLIVHKGIFSPAYDKYFYTVSRKDFTNFEVFQIQKEQNNWSKPKKAFFNSEYDEHGMSFSPDGNLLFFSSTRPTSFEELPNTWHIWNSEKINNRWTNPKFVNISNMKDKLVSHPTVTNSGKIYFHASNLDYSEMNIYSSELINDKYQNAEIVKFQHDSANIQKCTPFISPDEDYIIFAEIHEDQLKLKYSVKDPNGKWNKPIEFGENINTNGQGNPFVTPDEKFLFFTKINDKNSENDAKWNVNWVKIEQILKTAASR